MTDPEFTKPVVPLGDLVVGAILPYGALLDVGALEQQDWLYCDGSGLDPSTYPDLFAVIGTLHGGNGTTTFNLPDYRGHLQRGVDDGTGRDPDANSRTAANPGGVAGSRVGSTQGHAAALPTVTPFSLNWTGAHSHTLTGVPTASSSTAEIGSARSIWTADSTNTDNAGAHTHTVNGGGDSETRPTNAYVNFLIRYRAPNSQLM
ncbi:microcystin-dependent protein [Kitasatospora sp. MAP12-15]|uniref:phage tail protein n=1 Tax=unclassified Kitasatospora TaxID=2633591 RepID=UPI00247376EB|nr:phage tail protein [Kitasatospora sp. MAP12-44]MDH6115348.1 microcystin-dependent protein [Kitasatospora sp. MAP12-44]